MNRSIHLLIPLVLVAVSSPTMAQSEDIPTTKVYERTQMLPNGIAFRTTVGMLAKMVEKGDREFAAAWVAQEMRMKSDRADAFLTSLLDSHALLGVETKTATNEHACSSGDAYKILDELYDVEEQVAENKYLAVADSLSENERIQFNNWLSRQKSTIVSSRVDFAKADQQRGTDSTKTLTRLCQEGKQ